MIDIPNLVLFKSQISRLKVPFGNVDVDMGRLEAICYLLYTGICHDSSGLYAQSVALKNVCQTCGFTKGHVSFHHNNEVQRIQISEKRAKRQHHVSAGIGLENGPSRL